MNRDWALLGLIGLVLLVCLIVFWSLFDILIPFLLGMAIAYLFDPVADMFEERGYSRNTATLIITIFMVTLIVIFAMLLLPVLVSQAVELATNLPEFARNLYAKLQPFIHDTIERFGIERSELGRENFPDIAGRAAQILASALTSLVNSGLLIANVFTLILITPVVSFYLLRDWDRLVETIHKMIPRREREAIIDIMQEMDEVISGFLRGQGLVCLFLAGFYSIGLWLVGLKYGLLIGIITGLFSYIPLIGMAVGTAIGLLVAIVTTKSIVMVLMVSAVFLLGQLIEGNFLSPRWVGSRIHLHPVWLVFAVLAGTALAGAAGTVFAVPIAAVMGVLVRRLFAFYRDSQFYKDEARGSIAKKSEVRQVDAS